MAAMTLGSRPRTSTGSAFGGGRHGLVVAATLLVAFVIGVVLGRGLSVPQPKPAVGARAPSASAADPGPRSVEANVPVGYARSQAGAVTAATTYLATAAERLLGLDGPARQAAVARMLAPDAGAGVSDDLLSPLATIDQARQAGHVADGRALVRLLPLAYKVAAYSPDRAQVAVWSSAVFTIEGLLAPTEAWSTTTVDLVWSAGDWRLYSVATSPGPVPAAPQAPVTPTGQLLDSVAGFSTYRYVAADS